MHSFESDYTAGARVEILRRLNETNLEQLPGYGSDKYCESAKEKIRAACDCPGADIFFMVGGTQTNAVVIDSMLPSYGGVIAAQTGHMADFEVLHRILRHPLSYIGCIGSRNKAAKTRDLLRQEGFSEEAIASVHLPIGLPILAQTPAEIAISIAGEMIRCRAEAAQKR